jgi:hypothetical protein
MDGRTVLANAALGNEKVGFVSLADVNWGSVNLARISWSQVNMLGEEWDAKQKSIGSLKKDKASLLQAYEASVRANRQLAVVLQTQGLNEDAIRFAYRAQILQKRVLRFQMTQSGAKLRWRLQTLGALLFSWFLFLLVGYGYRLWRSFLAYMLVIVGFTTVYYVLGAVFHPPLSLVNALGLSMTSFHGRRFLSWCHPTQ